MTAETPAPGMPTARVLNVTATTLTVMCPYCGRKHTHPNPARGHHRRAPGCGLYRSEIDRVTGYQFTIPRPRRTAPAEKRLEQELQQIEKKENDNE